MKSVVTSLLLSGFLLVGILLSDDLRGTPPEPGSSPVSDLPVHLDSDNPLLAARALDQLQQLDRRHIPELSAALNTSLRPRARAYLETKLDSLLRAVLEELDQAVIELEELRTGFAVEPGNAESVLRKNDLRNRCSELLEILRSGGNFLAVSLARHVEWISLESPLLLRIHRRLTNEILQDWQRQNPEPELAELGVQDLRWLASLPESLRSGLGTVLQKGLLEKACQDAWSNLVSFDPVLEKRGRRYFLDMGAPALQFLRQQAERADSLQLPLSLIREWEMRTRLRVPELKEGSHAVSLARWDSLPGEEQFQLLARLMGVMRDELRPTLYHVATEATDPVLRRRCAEFLSLFGDERGARILLLERRYGPNRLEAASRDAMIRAAYQLRDSGDLSGARLLLEDLNDRLPHDAAARHALGLVLLRQRDLKAAIDQFRISLELDSSRSTTHYNLACAFSLSGQPKEALASLGEAIRLGYDRFSHAAEDPDLKPLHDEPGFWDLIR
mgnify:CR=1 FL=1